VSVTEQQRLLPTTTLICCVTGRSPTEAPTSPRFIIVLLTYRCSRQRRCGLKIGWTGSGNFSTELRQTAANFRRGAQKFNIVPTVLQNRVLAQTFAFIWRKFLDKEKLVIQISDSPKFREKQLLLSFCFPVRAYNDDISFRIFLTSRCRHVTDGVIFSLLLYAKSKKYYFLYFFVFELGILQNIRTDVWTVKTCNATY